MNPAAAANVGLRRAAGHFVSPKAGDTYLSDEIIATIARRDLHENAVYRCDRCDVALSAQDLEELEDRSLLQHLESLDSTRHSRMPHPPQWYIRDLHTNAYGDFLLMSGRMWHTVRGFPLDSTVLSLDCDSLLMHTAAALGSHEICLPVLPHFQGSPRTSLHASYHAGVVSLAVQVRPASGQPRLVAAADAHAQPVRLPQAQGARRRKRSRPVNRAQLRQACRTMGTWNRSRTLPA